jgi:hypothetical protein
MYEQLSRLAVDICSSRWTPQHTVLGEPFVIFGFGVDSEVSLQDVVSTEQLKSGSILEGEGDTYLHRVPSTPCATRHCPSTTPVS